MDLKKDVSWYAFKPIQDNPIKLDFSQCKYLGEIHQILKEKFGFDVELAIKNMAVDKEEAAAANAGVPIRRTNPTIEIPEETAAEPTRRTTGQYNIVD